MSKWEKYGGHLRPDDEVLYNKMMLKRIPKDAPVASTFGFSPRLAGRFYYYSFHYIYNGFFSRWVPYPVPGNIAYALVDFMDPRLLTFQYPDQDIHMKDFFGKNHLTAVDMADNVVLFQKDGPPGPKPYETRPLDGKARGGLYVFQAGNVVLKTFSAERKRRHGFPFLDFTFHWRPAAAHQRIEAMDLEVVNASGQTVYSKISRLCYGIYPSWRWKPGEEVLEHYSLLLPESLPAGGYKVRMVLFPSKPTANKLENNMYPHTILTGFSIP